MPYEFPDEGNPGAPGGSLSLGYDPYGGMNRGGLIDELGGGTGYPGSGGRGPGFQAPPALPPTLPQGIAARGGRGGFAGGGYYGQVQDPNMMPLRKRMPFSWGGGGGGGGGMGGTGFAPAAGGYDGGYDPRMSQSYGAQPERPEFGGGAPMDPGRMDPNNPWVPPVYGGNDTSSGYATNGQYGGGPFIQYRSDQPGSIAALNTFNNLMLGGGAGTMFDPTGNYAPYLDSLQGDLNRNTGAMLDRTRLRASLDPNVDPTQANYAGLVGEASAFGGAQDQLSDARRGLADRNQNYMMNYLNQLLGLQTTGEANPYVDWNLAMKRQRASQPDQSGFGFELGPFSANYRG